MILSQAFENFILSKRVQGLSSKSISCYIDFVRPFVNDIGADIDISALTKEDVGRYILKLQKRETLSKASISTYIRHIKVFLLWIEEECETIIGAKKIKVPRSPKKVLHIYDDDEIRDVFNAVTADAEWLIYRNCAIVALMLDSGLRQNEVCTLKTVDVDFKKRIVKVCGKGNKERYIPFGVLSYQYMHLYSKMCPWNDEKTFFVARHGGSMSCDAVKHFITKIANKLPFELSSHKLRHNYATNYCLDQLRTKGQVDIYKLQILMGHEDVKTTQRYLHIATKLLALEGNVSHLDCIYFGET